MSLQANFYKNRVCLNVLANTIENAVEVYEAAEGHVLVGVLSINYDTVKDAVSDMKDYAKAINNAVSVGLGAGNPNQWKMVADICKDYRPQHVNQVFTGVGYTRACVDNDETLINCLVSPSGKKGYVKISTGPLSEKEEPAIVPVKTAIAMIKDMGGSSIKYFPMKGLETVEEYREVAAACAEEDLFLEPTGGIDVNNFSEIVEIALKAGVKKVIPHVYSSIIDKETGNTKVEDVKTLLSITKKLVDTYGK
ncbi:2-dehydro-3-deoxy-phosphogluconate aldolase [Heyndrickxia vini]|uniref:KDGP aldolase family protein n=1 Tax=Heyndrickxia vini TaxID=1476025 RepID=A0ABX7E5R5_9BACI|nr:KDGP aldolase family protein [Heyndrickxia vini]QQZ10122.1 KDGP aldolase family protein [Heyndrickxia vini]